MNYAKTAYLKVVELEKKIQANNTQTSLQNSFLEFDKNDIEQAIDSTFFEFEFPTLDLTKNSNICFQVQVCFTLETDDIVDSLILLDGVEIYEDKTLISSSQNQFLIMKTFSPVQTVSQKLSLKFRSNQSLNNLVFTSIKVVVMGLANINENSEIQLSALTFDNQVLISYVDTNRLYYQICDLSPQYVNAKNFTFLQSCISHAFMNSCAEKLELSNVLLLLVDENKKLYLKKPFGVDSNQFIDSDVSFVCGTLIESDKKQNLFLYIKNGKVYYSNIIDGRIIKSQKLKLPKGEYKEVSIATHKDSEFVYVVATQTNNASYILRSVIEFETGKFIETIKANYIVKISKYVDMQISDRSSIETVKASCNFLVNPFVVYQKLLDSRLTENLKCALSYSNELYETPNHIVYGVKLDKLNPIGKTWATYTDDAVDFEGAYMDFENDKFVDNGWESRWPFTEIRPCLFDCQTHEVIGYLDKNDFSKFTDGSPADIYTSGTNIVAIEFPQIFYSITSDSQYIYIKISNEKTGKCTNIPYLCNEKMADKLYVSAYPSPGPEYETNDLLRIYSGMKFHPADKSYSLRVKTLLATLGSDISVISYYFNTLVCCLFAIMFKSTDARASLGVGFTETRTEYYTGELDKKGMNYGSNKSGHTKLFGMEDYYGLTKTITTGVYVNKDTGHYFYYDGRDEALLFPEIHQTFKEYKSLPFPKTSTVITSLVGDNVAGFLSSTKDGETDLTLGFCDKCSLEVPIGKLPLLGNAMGEAGGLFAIQIFQAAVKASCIIRPFYQKFSQKEDSL